MGEAEEVELGVEQGRFIVADDAETYLVSRVASNVVVCLKGTGIDDSNRDARQTDITNAIMAWVDAIRPSSRATLLQAADVTFSCNAPHVTVDWSADTGRASAGRGSVALYDGNGFNVVLHEFGHVFGIGDTYTEGVFTCHPGQENSVMCGFGGIPSVLTRDDINGIQEAYALVDPTNSTRRWWNGGSAWCNQSFERLLIGDFNADNRKDLLCHNTSTGHLAFDYTNASAQVNGTNWQRDARWCNASTQRTYIGDFNKDNRDDLLCHDEATGWISIDYANSSAQFNGTNWQRDARWCLRTPSTNPQLHVGDFNGDGYSDLLCFDASVGYFSVDHANTSGQFNGTNWERDARWCANPSVQRLLVGDFNGDDRDDLLCHDASSGHKWVDHANASGQFNGTNWDAALNWCNDGTAELHVEDFNGDGRTDMACHDRLSGKKWIANAQPGGNFAGTSRVWPMRFCHGNLLLPGDYDANGSADFLCHEYNNGNKWLGFQFQ